MFVTKTVITVRLLSVLLLRMGTLVLLLVLLLSSLPAGVKPGFLISANRPETRDRFCLLVRKGREHLRNEEPVNATYRKRGT